MKYPAIVKGIGGDSFLCANEIDYYDFHLEYWGKWDNVNGLKNITAEYLANTYGEVKSKEHAEFIVKLCENAGIDVFPQLLDANYFVIKGKLSFHNCERITSSELKQITIPLPPKCEEKTYRYEGVGHKPKHFDCICTKCGGRCCIGNCDEWPKVGSKVTWGTKAVNGEVKAIDNDNDFAWVKNDYGNYVTVYVGHLEKPKTPEQELQEDLINIFQSSLDGGHFVGKLMAKYNITKKGEGDES